MPRLRTAPLTLSPVSVTTISGHAPRCILRSHAAWTRRSPHTQRGRHVAHGVPGLPRVLRVPGCCTVYALPLPRWFPPLFIHDCVQFAQNSYRAPPWFYAIAPAAVYLQRINIAVTAVLSRHLDSRPTCGSPHRRTLTSFRSTRTPFSAPHRTLPFITTRTYY